MNKSKIEWCDSTWNPVTGCMHGCEYCYAERIAERFAAGSYKQNKDLFTGDFKAVLDIPVKNQWGNSVRIEPYPYGFHPTFHKYRLNEPQKVKKPSKIFVCSMADLFGEWVPDEWIMEVFKTVRECPQHTFLFLTKNPKRYRQLVKDYYNPIELPENAYYGTTITSFKDKGNAIWLPHPVKRKTFVSIEPLLGYFGDIVRTGWVIIGAQTGSGAKPPWPELVQHTVDQYRAAGVPVFLKDNLKWHEKIQEWPDGLR